MAKKRSSSVNKAEEVRKFWETNPKATGGDVVRALKKRGITISANYPSVIKAQLRNKGKSAAAPTKPAAPVAVAPAAPTINLRDHLKQEKKDLERRLAAIDTLLETH